MLPSNDLNKNQARSKPTYPIFLPSKTPTSPPFASISMDPQLVGNAVSQLAPVAGALVGAAGGLAREAQTYSRFIIWWRWQAFPKHTLFWLLVRLFVRDSFTPSKLRVYCGRLDQAQASGLAKHFLGKCHSSCSLLECTLAWYLFWGALR